MKILLAITLLFLFVEPIALAQNQSTPILVRAQDQRSFSGKETEIYLEILGSPQEHVDLFVNIFQSADALSARLNSQPLRVAENLNLQKNGIRPFTFHLPSPTVKRQTQLELRYLARMKGPSTWHEVGKSQLTVFPKDILDPLRRWSKKNNVRIKDKTGLLTSFLKNEQIHFIELGDNQKVWTNKPGVTLIAGFPVENFLEKDFSPNRHVSVVIFREDLKGLLPFIDRSQTNGTWIEVWLPILQKLETDPETQKTFLKIIDFSQNQEPLWN